MPTVIFHVSGKKLNPAAALAKVTFKPYQVLHAGDVVKNTRGSCVLEKSGFSVDLGPRKSQDLRKQIKVAKAFAEKHYAGIKRIKGADNLHLDFGYLPRLDDKGKPFALQCDYLSPDFLKICGELNIGIVLSRYGLSKAWSYYGGKVKN